MNKIIIDKLIIPTTEVVAKVFSNPSINVVPVSGFWDIVSAIASVVLALSVIFGGFFWLKENYWINRWHRYLLEPGHSEKWIQKNLNQIYRKVRDRELLNNGQIAKSIYCIKIINRGTTHDYIYRAEFVNYKGKRIDISTDYILKGTDFVVENLPHVLLPLQGEVWFIEVKDYSFVLEKRPKLIIYSAAGKYELQMDERMFITSKDTKEDKIK